MSDSATDEAFESFELAEDERFVFHRMDTCYRCGADNPVFRDMEQSNANIQYTIVHPCKSCMISDARNYFIPLLLIAYSEDDGVKICEILDMVKDKLGDEAGGALVKDAASLYVNGFEYSPEVFDVNND